MPALRDSHLSPRCSISSKRDYDDTSLHMIIVFDSVPQYLFRGIALRLNDGAVQCAVRQRGRAICAMVGPSSLTGDQRRAVRVSARIARKVRCRRSSTSTPFPKQSNILLFKENSDLHSAHNGHRLFCHCDSCRTASPGKETEWRQRYRFSWPLRFHLRSSSSSAAFMRKTIRRQRSVGRLFRMPGFWTAEAARCLLRPAFLSRAR